MSTGRRTKRVMVSKPERYLHVEEESPAKKMKLITYTDGVVKSSATRHWRVQLRGVELGVFSSQADAVRTHQYALALCKALLPKDVANKYHEEATALARWVKKGLPKPNAATRKTKAKTNTKKNGNPRKQHDATKSSSAQEMNTNQTAVHTDESGLVAENGEPDEEENEQQNEIALIAEQKSTAYQVERLERIKANQAMLAGLGISLIPSSSNATVEAKKRHSAAAAAAAAKRRRATSSALNSAAAASKKQPIPERISRRLRKMPAPSSGELDNCDSGARDHGSMNDDDDDDDDEDVAKRTARQEQELMQRWKRLIEEREQDAEEETEEEEESVLVPTDNTTTETDAEKKTKKKKTKKQTGRKPGLFLIPTGNVGVNDHTLVTKVPALESHVWGFCEGLLSRIFKHVRVGDIFLFASSGTGQFNRLAYVTETRVVSQATSDSFWNRMSYSMGGSSKANVGFPLLCLLSPPVSIEWDKQETMRLLGYSDHLQSSRRIYGDNLAKAGAQIVHQRCLSTLGLA